METLIAQKPPHSRGMVFLIILSFSPRRSIVHRSIACIGSYVSNLHFYAISFIVH